MAFQWAGRYGSLDTGHYRAVKWFFEFHENETEQDKRVVDFALAAEFDINLTLNSLASGFPFPDSDGCRKLLNDYSLSRADIL